MPAIHEGRGVTARLEPREPELRATLEILGRRGHLRARVEISPDHLAQKHRMDFEVDQSYLPEMVRQCFVIVQRYPTR